MANQRQNTIANQEDTAQTLAEYRCEGFFRQAMPHVVYHAPHDMCPWPGCGCRIAGIDFQLDKMTDLPLRQKLHASWWQGPGLVGRCPGCRNYVLFGLSDKQMIPDVATAVVMPDDWFQSAYTL